MTVVQMATLQGKSILFIGPVFFGYEKEIANELIAQGAAVDFLPDRPFASPFAKAVMRFKRSWVLPLADKFFMESVKGFARRHYDMVFVVQGEGLSLPVLKFFRSSFPRAKLIWYLWDSLKNKPALKPNLTAFDECFTFDASDANTYGMNFRPLFFTANFNNSDTSAVEARHKYDLSFVGTAHSDRYAIAAAVAKAMPLQTNFYRYLYLQAPWVYWWFKFSNPGFKSAHRGEFTSVALSQKEVQQVFFDSFAVLDVEHPRQAGLTMRTFEAMGAQKKLITTNKNVIDTDFFDAQNILVIDRLQVSKIPEAFFQSPYVPRQAELVQKYALSGWLRDVVYQHLPRTE